MNKSAEDITSQVEEHFPKIKNFIRKRVSNKEDAEDILQDVFYQFVNTLQTTLQPIESVSAWLFRVSRNIIINKQKKKKEVRLLDMFDDEDDDMIEDYRDLLFPSADEADSPESKLLRDVVWDELNKALLELPQEQREVFELTEFEDLSLKEISAKTGIAVNTLLSRKHYAVKHLRKRMKVLYDEITNKLI